MHSVGVCSNDNRDTWTDKWTCRPFKEAFCDTVNILSISVQSDSETSGKVQVGLNKQSVKYNSSNQHSHPSMICMSCQLELTFIKLNIK